MTGRDPDETHRAATPLELLFDLCFVVAVAQAAGALHHDLAEGHLTHGVLSYAFVFFAIWWPWVNFTWFASAFDTDDVLYRLLTFVQIAGVLVVTAGVPSAFDSLDFRVMVVGYVLMRIALVAQWLRAAREDPAHRRIAVRFAGAITLIQLGWIGRLALDGPSGFVAILLLAVFEMALPIWAESAGRPTPWNPGHVTERYGLFTIIVIGECVLAATTAVQAAFTADGVTLPLLAVALGGLLLVFGLWWLYFKDTAALGAADFAAIVDRLELRALLHLRRRGSPRRRTPGRRRDDAGRGPPVGCRGGGHRGGTHPRLRGGGGLAPQPIGAARGAAIPRHRRNPDPRCRLGRDMGGGACGSAGNGHRPCRGDRCACRIHGAGERWRTRDPWLRLRARSLRRGGRRARPA